MIKKHVALKQQGEQNFNENLLKQEHQVAEINKVLDEVQKIKIFWETTAAVN